MSIAEEDRAGAAGGFLVIVLAIAVVIWAVSWGVHFLPGNDQSQLIASPYVKLSLTDGHGSGVYIGNGNILTAGHVASAVPQGGVLEVIDDKGDKTVATVLWASPQYDVALVHVAGLPADAAKIDCAANVTGQHVTIYGNPLELDFTRTSGFIAGKARSMGPWVSAVPIDATILPGQSGGAVVNDAGDVVGIAVGMPELQGAPTALGVIVPASTICSLLGH